METSSKETYLALASEFDETHHDVRGGVQLEYITGEQCISRLNDILGFDRWSFTVKEHGINAEADEAWVLGELTVSSQPSIGGERIVTRQQFGSQKLKRSRASGTPLDIGFDLKGAATDALKKCAMWVGVGLYLSKKEPQANGRANGNGRQQEPDADALALEYAAAQGKAQPTNGASHQEPAQNGEAILCAECGAELRETRFRDGTVWPPSQLAGYGRNKHNRVLCMEHYRSANEARRRAERTTTEVPF